MIGHNVYVLHWVDCGALSPVIGVYAREELASEETTRYTAAQQQYLKITEFRVIEK